MNSKEHCINSWKRNSPRGTISRTHRQHRMSPRWRWLEADRVPDAATSFVLTFFFFFPLTTAVGYTKHGQRSFGLFLNMLIFCSFSLSTSSLVKKLSSHDCTTTYPHYLNLPVTHLEKNNWSCRLALSDTSSANWNKIISYPTQFFIHYFWFWFTSFYLRC